MSKVIGECKIMNGTTLIVNVLGNHLPEESEGYNPCLEVECEEHSVAWHWYCKAFKIEFNENNLMDSQSVGFKKINFNNCSFTELTENEIKVEVENYLKMYA